MAHGTGLDPKAHVYATDPYTGLSGGEPAPCMWFAGCGNLANGLRTGPVGNGAFGDIPICKRCDDKCERLSR